MTHNPFAEDETQRRAQVLADFFSEFGARLLADLEESGTLAGAKPAAVAREWDAVALHACVRGAVLDRPQAPETADLVDAFHDLVLAGGVAEGAYETPAARRMRLAARYGEYDGLARVHGQRGASEVPRAIAAACAAHLGATDATALTDTLAPLLEALAEGAHMAATAPPGPQPALPPYEGLRMLTARLDAAGIEWAVGGSGLLAAYGLVNRVNDWDVQVEAGPAQLQELFADVPHEFFEHNGCHADWKLTFAAQQTELIPRFAFAVPGGVVRVPMKVSRRWNGLPIASPEGWACAYWIMGEHDDESLRAKRAERAELLLGWLARHGADRARLEIMRAERLPEVLAARLAVLPRR